MTCKNLYTLKCVILYLFDVENFAKVRTRDTVQGRFSSMRTFEDRLQ